MPAGRPKVLDFVIAKLLPDLGGSYTQTGSLLGTPHYMSPEQAAGKHVDYRTDLYAMGIILFECTTGQKPFHGDSLFDLLKQHVEAPPPSPRQFRPDMPPALEQVILTALAKAPEQRFQSAQAMSMALQQATQQLPPPQWAPITAATASGAMHVQSGATWSSTPASWSASASRAPVHPTTVSGQVGAAPAATVAGKKSKTRLVDRPGGARARRWRRDGGGGRERRQRRRRSGGGSTPSSPTATIRSVDAGQAEARRRRRRLPTAPSNVGGGGGGGRHIRAAKIPTPPTPTPTPTPTTPAENPQQLATSGSDTGDGDPTLLAQMEQAYTSLR